MHFLTDFSILLTLSVVTSGVSGAALHHVHRHASLTCYEDNSLRALERFPSDAAVFCPKFLKTPSQQVPSNFAGVPASKLSSACACFERTATPANPVVTPTTTPTSAPVVVPTPTSLFTIKSIPSSSSVPTVSSVQKPTALPLTSLSSNTLSSTSGSSNSRPTDLPTNEKDYTGGKRGLVYDYKSQEYSSFFKDSRKIAFGSDWGVKRSPAPGVTLDIGAFVPTIAVDSSLQNAGWFDAVKALIGSGSPMIFAYVEPLPLLI